MLRKIDVGSVFGNAQRTSYEYMKLLDKKTNGDFKTLVVDDKDGLHSIPFANHGSNVVMYEPNEIYIKGGTIDDFEITPITNRKNYKKIKSKIEIRNSNFYESKIEEKYDLVYCYRSLHENHNKKIPMKRKIRKLLSSVKDDGYIYIFYHMAKNENDISNFSKNQYFRKGEMKSYFDPRIWDIITIIEDKKFTNHNGHPYHKKNHEHKVGHVFARKKNTRLVHKYYYDIIENSINKDLEKEALSQGFDSVEAWRNHNAMCNESVETWRDYNAKCTESATVLLH